MRDFKGERGQVLPFVAICLTVLMGFSAFAVDVGYLRYQMRLQQTAADAGALAGAHELLFNPSQPAAEAAAKADALKNGIANSNVIVYYPPRSGPFTGDTSAVEVIVSVPQAPFFSGVIGYSSNTVTARAVAKAEVGDGQACFFVMQNQLNINSVHANLQLPTCGVMVNGDIKGQNGTVVATYLAATGTISNGKNFASTTQILQGIPQFADPCSTIPGCAAMVSFFNADPNGQEGAAIPPPTYNSTTGLPPGHYTSWPTSSSTLCLQKGLFIVDSAGTTADLVGPGLPPANGGSTCPGTAGDGVTIDTSGMDLNVGSNSNLEAPTPSGISSNCNASNYGCVSQLTGAPGVVFYDSCTCNMPWNNSSNTLMGMMYFPNAKVELNGTNSTLNSSFIVAGQVIGNQLDLNVPTASTYSNLNFLATLVE